jgi:hypothetical protein
VSTVNDILQRTTELVQSLKQFDLFGCKEVRAEAAHFTERACLAKDKRAGRPFPHAADQVPGSGQQVTDPIARVEFDRAASGDAPVFGDCVADIFKQRAAWVRIRIDKDQPVACGNARTTVARPADLVDRLENDLRAAGAGELRGAVRGIVIANNDFVFPLACCDRFRRR